MYIYVVQRTAVNHDGYVSAKIECAFHTYDEARAYVMDTEKLDKEASEDGDCDFAYTYQIHKIWLN